MIKGRGLYLAIAAGVIVVIAIASIHFYDLGRRNVALKATQDSVKVIEAEKAIIAKQRDSVGKALAIASNKSNETRLVYRSNNTRIKGDSTFDSTGKFIQVLDHRITKRILDADAHISNLESELATAKYALKVDTVFIAKTEKISDLNKSIAKLTKGSRFTKGLQIGVGYCRNQSGGTPCVYAGYGLSVH